MSQNNTAPTPKVPSIFNQEYAELCKQYGHLSLQAKSLQEQLSRIEARMTALDSLQPKMVEVEQQLSMSFMKESQS